MWNWIKIPKGLALAAFILPWMTVSCSGTKLVEGNGFQLAFGNLTVLSEKAAQDGKINIWLILALASIIAGLVLCFIKGREAAKLVIGTSAGALLLILVGTSQFSKSAIMAAANKGGSASGDEAKMQEAALAMIQVEWHLGYYLALVALIAAAVMAFLVMQNKDAEAEARIREAAGNLGDTARDLADKAADAVKKDDPPKP